MQTPFFYIKHFNILLSIIILKLHWLIAEKLYLKMLFRLNVGYCLNLKNPKTFNEKLQWLKLYDRNPNYTQLVDKYEVKNYIANLIGEKYIIPTLGVWETAEQIDWESLPNQFVLKTTHGSGGSSVVICKDKSTFDKESAISLLNNSLKNSNTWAHYREWPYKNIKRRVIAERFLNENGRIPNDYKIHNFNGEPKFILVCRNRFQSSGMIDDFYTTDWKHIDVKRPGKDNPGGVTKPIELDEILRLSKILSKNIPFARTDFYTLNGNIYFGEITFYPASGLSPFEPKEFDYLFGDYLKLKTFK